MKLKIPKQKQRLLLISLIVSVAITTLLVSKLQTSKTPPSPTIVTPQYTDTIRKITVEISEDCKTEPASCYEEGVRTLLLDKYPTAQILEAIYDFDKYYSCHAFAHFLGRALYRKTGSIPDAYSQIDFTCHGGTYHGVLEAYLEERQTTVDDISGDELEKICSDSPKKSVKNKDQIFTECLHGFGHAFMFITNADLPTSLAYCDKLDPQYEERCWGGAFMENSTSSTNIDHPTQWLKADDKFYPCTILNDRYLKQCYFYQANYLLKITNRDYKQVFADCGQLKDQGQHDYCILGAGAQLASVSNEQGVTTAARVCQIGQGNDAYICIEGAVPSLFARYGGDAPQIFEYCSKVASNLREFCFAKLGMVARTYWQYSQDRINQICHNAGEFAASCAKEDNSFKY